MSSQSDSYSSSSKRNSITSEHPIQYYNFKHVDHNKVCPQYSSLLQLAVDDAPQITDDMLEDLHKELTMLDQATSERNRLLSSELEIVIEWLDRKDKKGDNSSVTGSSFQEDESNEGIKASSSGVKRSKHEEQVNKKQKLKGSTSKKQKDQKRTKEVSIVTESDKKLKSDAPSRFWSAVDAYCADVTQDDVKTLDQIIDCEDYTEYYKIPSLGVHYTKRWAREDMMEERSQGKRAAEADCNGTNGFANDLVTPSKEVDKMLNDNDGNNLPTNDSDEFCPIGTLTQRLIASLVEENIVAPPLQIFDGDSSNKSTDGRTVANPKSRHNFHERDNRSAQISSGKNLEERLHEELIALNILSRDDVVIATDKDQVEDEDEVLSELMRRQQELRAVSQCNTSFKQQLREATISEMKRQKLLQSVRAADNETIDFYKRFTTNKQKKKSLAKEETEFGWRLLKNRQLAIRKLNEFDSSV